MARLRFAPAWQPSLLRSAPKAKAGGKGIRTPDFQLAKLALYQLSYAPDGKFRISIADFRLQGRKQKGRIHRASGLCALVEMAKSRPCAEDAAVFPLLVSPDWHRQIRR